MTRVQAYLIGMHYPHHAIRSGYAGLGRYVGLHVRSPVKFRYMTSRSGQRIDGILSSIASRPYGLGILFTELAAILHMLARRRSLFHVLYGDTDLWLLARVSRLTGHAIVATFHQPAGYLPHMGVNQQATKSLDAVILVSESQRPYFQKIVPPERIFVVPHGVDTDFFRPARDLSDQQICITVGSHLRDYDTLTRAIELIRESRVDVRFLAVGTRSGSGWKKGFHHKHVECLDELSDEQLRQAYHLSQVAVFALDDATANNALLEAMACGLPVVATDVGGIREYLGEEAGVLCPPGNPEAVAAAMLRVVGERGYATRLGRASRARALNYDYRIVAKQLNRVYLEVVRAKWP